jgi:integrase
MASRDGITKIGPGHYRVHVELPRGADGKRNRHDPTVHGTRADAKALRAKLLAEAAHGGKVGTADQTLGAYLESWLGEQESQVSLRTRQRYTSLLMGSVVPTLGNVRLGDLTAQHLSDYYRDCLANERTQRGASEAEKEQGGRPISPTTVHHRHVTLKTALKRAVEQGLIARNPADMAVAPKRIRGELRVLDEKDAGALLAALGGTSSDLLAFVALYTGARLGEVLALRWRDFDTAKQMLYIRRKLVEPLRGKGTAATWYSFGSPKSGSGRAIDLDAATVKRLKQHRAKQNKQRVALPAGAWHDLDLIFTNVVGEPLRESRASRTFSSRAKKAGFEGLRFHDLRHTHATLLLMAGQPPHVVSRRLGHSDVGFTLRVYADVLPSQARGAADAFAGLMQGARKAV